MTSLDQLHIRGFRGIPDATLPFAGGSIVMGGANGTGKSACVDAIEFLYTGGIYSLTGTQGLSLKQHGPHIRANANESWVRAQFREPDGEALRRLTGPTGVATALEAHFAQGSSVSFILRRAQLQQFIHAKPADRYRSMADLLGAEALDRTETALKRARDAADQQLRTVQTQMAQTARQLDELPDDTSSDEEMVTEANRALEEVAGNDLRLASIDDAGKLRASVLREIADRKPDARAQAQARLLAEIGRGIGEERLSRAMTRYTDLAGGGGPRQAGMIELLQLLRRGREYLGQNNHGRCPLCEQPVDDRLFLDRLVDRVQRLEEVSLHEENLRQARDELLSVIQDTAARLRALETLQADAGVRGPAGPVQNAGSMLTESVRAGALTESREMAARLTDALALWTTWAAEAAPALETRIRRPDDSDDTAGAQHVLAILEQFTARRAQAERGRQEQRRLTELSHRLATEQRHDERVLQMADATYQTFLRVRNEEIQRIYDELRTDLARMYDFLHPGEGHGMVAIALDPRKRGSSELRMGFHGREEEDPRAFASEGHLDSLGLCIFLAFAKRFNGNWPLLVLDDVVSSVDAAHKQRIGRLLFEEFGDRQLFITTHDSRWFLDLRRVQEELGRKGVTNIVIESWNLENGPKLRIESPAPSI